MTEALKTDRLEQAKREIAGELKALKDAISEIGHFRGATCDDGITNERDPDNCKRCYLDQEFEAAENMAVAERARNLELREQIELLQAKLLEKIV